MGFGAGYNGKMGDMALKKIRMVVGKACLFQNGNFEMQDSQKEGH